MTFDASLGSSLWLAAQGGSAAREIEREIKRLARENYALSVRVQHMINGFPDGVTKDEWDILKELRRCTPTDKGRP